MSDTLSPKARSERMSRVKAKDTKPEMTLRRLVHGLGFRYRLHRRDLPGTPDLVFPGRRAVIFMHGCFWHRHPGCGLTRMPKSRVEFWRTKLEANRERDLRHQRALAEMGWRVLVVWECELRDLDAVASKVEAFLTQEEA
ncbi:DNA mismatch endonuclease Vsr [Alcanivorax xiamenensis]|uniref:Very short patch repair endonuclease n=1 Tax=Alcanivorax xiamenensis TaxID=1177156 RepID=A0ABQ6YCW8_9GAMM|nr:MULTISPECIES: very short patch repair endonuclease [Alcanivorax]KAF0807657.1 DNA mismatch endonuclease Vsr [Alcanivorax xiamenensis]